MAPAWHADIACHRRPQSQAGQAESAGPAVLRPAKTVARRADEEKSSQAAEGCEARPRIAASRRRSHAAIPTRRSIRTSLASRYNREIQKGDWPVHSQGLGLQADRKSIGTGRSG